MKLVLSRITEDDSKKVYQGSTLYNYSDTMLSSLSAKAMADLENLDGRIKERLSWSDTKLLRSMIVFLDTRSWAVRSVSNTEEEEELGYSDDKAHIKDAVENILITFREPLEAKGMSVFSMQDELEEIVDFYRQYLDAQGEDYRKVWYKLFTAPDARKWPNITLLSELLFSLPFVNSKVERAFSIMKIIKTDRRNCLHTNTLDNLMEINVEGPPPESFSAEHAVKLWWEDRTRRPNQASRKEYKKRSSADNGSSDDSESEPENTSLTLDTWDDWFISHPGSHSANSTVVDSCSGSESD